MMNIKNRKYNKIKNMISNKRYKWNKLIQICQQTKLLKTVKKPFVNNIIFQM